MVSFTDSRSGVLALPVMGIFLEAVPVMLIAVPLCLLLLMFTALSAGSPRALLTR